MPAKLRNAAQAQQDYWRRSVEAEIAGNEAEAKGARVLAGLLGREQAGLEKAREACEGWERRTAQARSVAAKATKELERRGVLEEVTAKPAESTAAWDAEFNAQADAAEAAIEREREATAEAGAPWPPGARGARVRADHARGSQSGARDGLRKEKGGRSLPLPALTVYAPSNRALRVTTERVTWSADLADLQRWPRRMRAAIAAKVTATSSGVMPMCLISRAIVPIVWESPDSAAWIIPAAIGDSSSCPGIAGGTGHLP